MSQLQARLCCVPCSKRLLIASLTALVLSVTAQLVGGTSYRTERRILQQTLGGVTVAQTLTQLCIAPGGPCTWVLEGGTAEQYVTEDCLACKHLKATAAAPEGLAGDCAELSDRVGRTADGCAQVRGPDCRLHLVNAASPQLPCDLPLRNRDLL